MMDDFKYRFWKQEEKAKREMRTEFNKSLRRGHWIFMACVLFIGAFYNESPQASWTLLILSWMASTINCSVRASAYENFLRHDYRHDFNDEATEEEDAA